MSSVNVNSWFRNSDVLWTLQLAFAKERPQAISAHAFFECFGYSGDAAYITELVLRYADISAALLAGKFDVADELSTDETLVVQKASRACTTLDCPVCEELYVGRHVPLELNNWCTCSA